MTRQIALLLALTLAGTMPALADPGRFGVSSWSHGEDWADVGAWNHQRPRIEPGTGVTHQLEGRFGVSYVSDGQGNSETLPMAGLRYTATFRHQFDNGWRVAVAVGVEASNFADYYGRRTPNLSWH